jgi:hypothetical protein
MLKYGGTGEEGVAVTRQQIGLFRIGAWKIQVSGLLAVPVGLTIAVALFVVRLPLTPPSTIHIELVPLSLWWLAGSLLIIPVHEAIHGIGALASGVDVDRIRFGFKVKGLVPYCHVRGAVTVAQMRLFGAAPLVVTGGIGAALVLVFGTPLTVLLLATAIATSAGDVLILWILRNYRGDDICDEGEDIFELVISRPPEVR